MKALFILIVLGGLLGACAHQDLKAPCAATASLDSVPCDQRQPVIGLAFVTDERR